MSDKGITWSFGQRSLTFPRRTLIMGIVNVNDDSFSGDGSLNCAEVTKRCIQQINDGADIIDIGAESARTNRGPITCEEESRRLFLVLEQWEQIIQEATPRDEQQVWPPILSINTWRTEVITEILSSTDYADHIDLVNDMSALPTECNARAVANSNASLLIMHSVGAPKESHQTQRWESILSELLEFFREKIAIACEVGLARNKIIIDPGLDFAKQTDDSLTVMRNLENLEGLKCPILVPISRKTFLGESLDREEPRDRDAATVGCLPQVMTLSAAIVRVHNVNAIWQGVKVLCGILGDQ